MKTEEAIFNGISLKGKILCNGHVTFLSTEIISEMGKYLLMRILIEFRKMSFKNINRNCTNTVYFFQ